MGLLYGMIGLAGKANMHSISAVLGARPGPAEIILGGSLRGKSRLAGLVHASLSLREMASAQFRRYIAW